MKRAIIKDSFTAEEKYSGSLLVTPKSFKTVKDWTGYQVEGLDYYVNQACAMGASKSDAKSTTKKAIKAKPRSDK